VTREAAVEEGGIDELEGMRNLGPVSAARLRAVGIASSEDLKRVGAIEAYIRLKRIFPAVTRETALYALHGAVTGVRWYTLSDEIRAALRDAAARRL
jgi:TfoX-like protein